MYVRDNQFRNRFLTGLVLLQMTVLFLGWANPAYSGEMYTRALEQAIESACDSLEAAGLGTVQNIAVLPVNNDVNNEAYGLVRIGLTQTHYSVFDRQDAEWERLLSEIEWGQRRGDIMDAATVQEFGQIQGVEAVLYGSLVNVEESPGRVMVRLNLHLSVVETGQHVWGVSVVGTNSDRDLVAASLWERVLGGITRSIFLWVVGILIVLIVIRIMLKSFLSGVQKPR